MSDRVLVIDEESCPVCHKSLYAPEVASYSIVYWDPVAQGNELVQMVCSLEHLKEWMASYVPPEQWFAEDSE